MGQKYLCFKKIINLFLITTAFVILLGVSHLVLAVKKNEIAVENTHKYIDYPLPYPGILPDHPLFFLKNIRDFLIISVISDLPKKVNLYLLLADKQINSAYFLLSQKKYHLIPSLISKSQNFFSRGLEILEKEKENFEFKSLQEKYQKANLKHEEILTEILTKIPQEFKPEIRNLIEKNKNLRLRLQKF